MKIYRKQNVFDAALDRIRRIYDEFDNIIVSVSGGKDSTIVYNLALIVAKEKNRLPLKVQFIDQEAEWDATIDAVRKIMDNPDVEAYWYQMPFKIFNATSTKQNWLYCWEEGEKWIREKEPNSIKENVYGTDRFKEIFTKLLSTNYPDSSACNLVGMRAEESPARALAMRGGLTYKDITWGKVENKSKGHYCFQPIYDWSYTDVWKAIHDNNWDYCKIYDYQYMYGVSLLQMRVSNVHHETAVSSLFYMQELEPDTYERIVQRVQGIDTAGKMGKADFFVKELPYMFEDWAEYRDYLLETIIEDNIKPVFVKAFKKYDGKYVGTESETSLMKCCVNSMLCNDYYLTKLDNFRITTDYYRKR